MLRKFNLNELEIVKLVDENILKICTVMPIGFETYKVSSKLRLDYKLSYWDSLIVSSAIESKCSILYSEDMQHDQIINNQLKIIDPFF
jgi:predicted nucleic acid-binding protein